MAVFSLITAFDTLLVSSMEQRGPTVTSCGGFLIYHPHTRSAHEFSTASPWISSRSHHPHPVPGMLCTLWTASIQPQPVLTSEPCSFCRRCGLAWERIRSQSVGERHCPMPATWDTTLWRHSSSFPERGQPLEAAWSTHTMYACSPFKENSSKVLKENGSWGWTWTTSTTDCDAGCSSWAQCSSKCKVFASSPICCASRILAV